MFLEKMEVLSVKENEIVLGSQRRFIAETLSKQNNKLLIGREVKHVFSNDFSLRFKHVPSAKAEKSTVSATGKIVQSALDMFDGELVT